MACEFDYDPGPYDPLQDELEQEPLPFVPDGQTPSRRRLMKPKPKIKYVRQAEGHGKLRFVQIVVAQYEGESGLSSSIAALGNDGRVYQYRHTMGGWLPLPMAVVQLVDV